DGTATGQCLLQLAPLLAVVTFSHAEWVPTATLLDKSRAHSTFRVARASMLDVVYDSRFMREGFAMKASWLRFTLVAAGLLAGVGRPASGMAQEASPPSVTLEEAIRLALDNDPAAIAAEA